MPLVVNVAVKPTASIAKPQDTVDLEKRENATLTIHGRHDPCIVPRAVPVVEAVTALTLLDMMMEEG
jgi:chorismate synthase